MYFSSVFVQPSILFSLVPLSIVFVVAAAVVIVVPFATRVFDLLSLFFSEVPSLFPPWCIAVSVALVFCS